MALVNGIEFSWASLSFGFLGNSDVKGVKSINYKKIKASENLYGQGDDPIAIGFGQNTYEGEIQLMMKDIRAIRAAAGKDLTEIAPFTITVQYANGTDPITTDKVLHCRFGEDGMTGEAGAVELPMTIPLQIAGLELGV